ncbi:hypothetical protein CSKR_106980 [Clonorchis sinensis]|uniref:Uncharacterized protein n=1 Tax=Clonorchis sinensis TaxID=79923 RepID=A0A3R7F133_CLOSI|nr:hypothetical protein CSKR_106980 [Clonorchis sinensis]
MSQFHCSNRPSHTTTQSMIYTHQCQASAVQEQEQLVLLASDDQPGMRNSVSVSRTTSSIAQWVAEVHRLSHHRLAISTISSGHLIVSALSRLGQPGSIPALVLPSGGMTVRHRKGATAEQFRFVLNVSEKSDRCLKMFKEAQMTDLSIHIARKDHSVIFRTYGTMRWLSLSAVAPFRCLTAMPPEGSARAGILPGCPSLDRGSREAQVGFEPWTFRSLNPRSNHRAISPSVTVNRWAIRSGREGQHRYFHEYGHAGRIGDTSYSLHTSITDNRTTLPRDRLALGLLMVRGHAALGLLAPPWPSWHSCILWDEVPVNVTHGSIATLKTDHHIKLYCEENNKRGWGRDVELAYYNHSEAPASPTPPDIRSGNPCLAASPTIHSGDFAVPPSGRRVATTVPKLSVIFFMSLCQIKGWSPLTSRHSEFGTRNSTLFGKQWFGMRNPWSNQRSFWCWMHSSMQVLVAQPKTRFQPFTVGISRSPPPEGE